MSALAELDKPKKRGKQPPTDAQLQAKRDKAAERKRNQRAREKAREHAFVPGQPCSITIKLTAGESAYLGKAMKLRAGPARWREAGAAARRDPALQKLRRRFPR